MRTILRGYDAFLLVNLPCWETVISSKSCVKQTGYQGGADPANALLFGQQLGEIAQSPIAGAVQSSMGTASLVTSAQRAATSSRH